MDNKPFRHSNVLIEIKTFATHKNDITLTPFMSDDEGKINISKKDIEKAEYNWITINGIMDHSTLNSAKPNIEINIISKETIDNRIKMIQNAINNTMPGFENKSIYKSFPHLWGNLSKKEIAIKMKIQNKAYIEELNFWASSYNYTHKISAIPKKDSWNGQKIEYYYDLQIDTQ